MPRSLTTSLVAVFLAASFTASCNAQSGSQGSGTVIQSQPIYRSQPVQSSGSSTQSFGSSTMPQSNSSNQGSAKTMPQGSSSNQGSAKTMPQGSSSMPKETFESKFWKYLKGSRYTQWSPAPGKTGDTYPGQSPHGATLKMYLNRAAAGRPAELPDTSILVKENYGPDGKTLMAITVMYRTKGYNPAAADWYWIKYLPDGRVDQKQTPNGPVRLAGKPNGCIECHVAAEGGDYAFFND